jgi:hypothetical protein
MDTQIARLNIAMVAVQSHQIKEIGYDSPTNTLAVAFYQGGYKGERGPNAPASLYHYSAVPPEVHTEFMAAESKGAFLKERIKGKFDYLRIN